MPIEGDGSAAKHSSRGVRPLWLVPIVVAALGVGAVGALGLTGQLGSPASDGPSDAPSPLASEHEVSPPEAAPDVAEPAAGSLLAAGLWFADEPGPLDVYPHPEHLEAAFIDPASVRFAVEQDDGLVASAWIAKNQAGELCLLFEVSDGASGATCGSPEAFVRRGLSMGVDDFTVSWAGEGVTIERTSG